ncbi:unnamed protein product, partial [Meganyctiphanes norvegica]
TYHLRTSSHEVGVESLLLADASYISERYLRCVPSIEKCLVVQAILKLETMRLLAFMLIIAYAEIAAAHTWEETYDKWMQNMKPGWHVEMTTDYENLQRCHCMTEGDELGSHEIHGVSSTSSSFEWVGIHSHNGASAGRIEH